MTADDPFFDDKTLISYGSWRRARLTPEIEPLLLRMATRRVVFTERSGPHRYFMFKGVVHDYGSPITFAEGESMTIG